MIAEFVTLDEAVRSSFPMEFTRVVAVREHGDFAIALFDTRRSAADPYLYEVHYQRGNGRWSEGSSSNGCGWHRYTCESDLGVGTTWGYAAPDADRARGEIDGASVEDGVVNGMYFLVCWDVPEADYPAVTAFRVRGEWVRA